MARSYRGRADVVKPGRRPPSSVVKPGRRRYTVAVPRARTLLLGTVLRARTLLLVALLLVAGCHPVVVRSGETSAADVAVPTLPVRSVNILGIGRADDEGRIVLRATGIAVGRGETTTIGLMGPGMIPGTGFVVIGIGFRASVVRYGETQGGSGIAQPAAVLTLVVPPDAAPGLYSIVALRGFEMAVLSGSIEVV
jgi:hypothetical protein